MLSKLRVTDNHRYLETEEGTPFLYLGDTAWELFHRLDREQATLYLNNRAEKGFTVIQAVAIAEIGGMEVPNPYGELPLIDKDPTRPNEAYLQHVDFIVEKANALGMYIGFLPTWGNAWKDEGAVLNPENARVYGEFVGKRYRDAGLIWILGGDRNIENEVEHATVSALAEGLRKGDDGNHLITFHPRGPGQSSTYFHNEPWLDFNMSQSSHAAREHDTGLFIDHDYQLDPPKPTLDGEPRYEHIPVGFYNQGMWNAVKFDATDIRFAAYNSLFAGACGFTYGNNNIWQMWQPGRNSRIGADVPWYEAIDHPGAFQMTYLKRLLTSRPFTELVPCQDMIVQGPTAIGERARAVLAADGSFAMIYSPLGKPFTVRKDVIKTLKVRETWFDPRYGGSYLQHTGDNAGYQTFVPPTSGHGNDWILVLDDPAQYPELPGKIN